MDNFKLDKNSAKLKKSNIIPRPYSSYGVIKGSLINESQTMFKAWNTQLSKKTNLNEIREKNIVGAPSQGWLKQVCKTFSRRFDPSTLDFPLTLASRTKTGIKHWKPLLLWHYANSESLTGDFFMWIYKFSFKEGVYLETSETLNWLNNQVGKGHLEISRWSEATRKRVAGALLKAAVDFDLLQGKIKRRFISYYLADEPLIYILLQALSSNRTTSEALADPRWLWFSLTEVELEHRLLLLHQSQRLNYYRAGSLIDLNLSEKTPESLIKKNWL
tara:strand:- start:50 stop:871 length:822 start_codon:yes stop_codon:yes gene_type:complete